jgi:hypothetical protein
LKENNREKESNKYSYGYNLLGIVLNDTTTIQVKRETVRVLDKLKKKYSVSSYDKTIRKMAEKEKIIPKSMFGAFPGLKPFKREEDDFHDL